MNESLEEAFGELIRQLSSLRKEVKAIRKSLNDERKPCYNNQEVMEMFGVATQTIKKMARHRRHWLFSCREYVPLFKG